MQKRILSIHDIECLCNFFSVTFYVPEEDKWYVFVIWKGQNDIKELLEFLLKKRLYLVGFNSEGYDYPLLHHIINHKDEYLFYDGETIAERLYKKSQQILDMEFSAIADKNKFIPNLDLYLIWHFNNKGRSCSLKHLEVAMRMENVEDMPIHHSDWITTQEQVDLILSYNKNDVEATYKFFLITIGQTDFKLYKGENKLQLRKDIMKMYGIPCLNYPDVKIGEELLLKLYCMNTGMNPWYVKKLRTPRAFIELKDCILPYIKFNTPPFQALHKWLMEQTIYTTSGVFSKIPYDNVKDLLPYVHPETTSKKKRELSCLNLQIQNSHIDYGTGGLHHSISGKFYSDEEWVILDIDVGSLYPSIGVQNNFYPEHLGEIFAKIYGDNIVSVRLTEKEKPKKERNPVIMNGFKLAANGTYGKSNEETSFLYDPMYTMKTTINGQLLISMLIEEILSSINSVLFLQCNTDGITIKLKRIELDKCLEICKEWETKTKLVLEYSYYKMMIIVDVSTYMAQYENGDLKFKNDFEIDKELYKNPSMRIVPIALREYFVNNIPIKETIMNHKDIYDFCLMVRCNRQYELYIRSIKDDKIVEEKASKTQRYYASNRGGVLYKKNVNEDSASFGKYNGVNVGQYVTLFNKYVKKDMKDYDIDYNFYIKECKKIIDKVEKSFVQQSLF